MYWPGGNRKPTDKIPAPNLAALNELKLPTKMREQRKLVNTWRISYISSNHLSLPLQGDREERELSVFLYVDGRICCTLDIHNACSFLLQLNGDPEDTRGRG